MLNYRHPPHRRPHLHRQLCLRKDRCPPSRRRPRPVLCRPPFLRDGRPPSRRRHPRRVLPRARFPRGGRRRSRHSFPAQRRTLPNHRGPPCHRRPLRGRRNHPLRIIQFRRDNSGIADWFGFRAWAISRQAISSCDFRRGGYADNGGNGAAWIFTQSGGVWTQQGAKLVGTGAVGAAYQGKSVSLSAGGNIAIVGGWADNSSTRSAVPLLKYLRNINLTAWVSNVVSSFVRYTRLRGDMHLAFLPFSQSGGCVLAVCSRPAPRSMRVAEKRHHKKTDILRRRR